MGLNMLDLKQARKGAVDVLEDAVEFLDQILPNIDPVRTDHKQRAALQLAMREAMDSIETHVEILEQIV